MTKLKRCAAVTGLLASWLVAGCTDPADKAAKKRIFSPEDPPKVVASANESLSPDKLAESGLATRRVLRMGAAEVTERIGPHHFEANVTSEWTGAGRSEQLLEKHVLLAGPGGVSGDFHATVDNSRDQGLEVIRVHKAVYARNRYGKFRQRLRDRGMAEREREEIYGAVRDFDLVFGGRLRLTSHGSAAVQGRSARKYAVSLLPREADGGEEDDEGLPKLAAPKGGVEESTARRIAFGKRQPQSVSGELMVDEKTGVVLQAHLEGKLSVPSPTGKEKAVTVKLVVDSAISKIGKDPGLKAPAEFVPDADKPLGIAAALDRFGIPHGAAKGDAGTEADLGEEEP